MLMGTNQIDDMPSDAFFGTAILDFVNAANDAREVILFALFPSLFVCFSSILDFFFLETSHISFATTECCVIQES